MREFEGHDDRDDAEGEDEEDREYQEGDHLRELYTAINHCDDAYRFIDVALVAVIQTGELHWEPQEEADDEGEDVDDVGFKDP